MVNKTIDTNTQNSIVKYTNDIISNEFLTIICQHSWFYKQILVALFLFTKLWGDFLSYHSNSFISILNRGERRRTLSNRGRGIAQIECPSRGAPNSVQRMRVNIILNRTLRDWIRRKCVHWRPGRNIELENTLYKWLRSKIYGGRETDFISN